MKRADEAGSLEGSCPYFLSYVHTQSEALLRPAKGGLVAEIHSHPREVGARESVSSKDQKPQESVAEYLQELKILFKRTYPKLAKDQDEEVECAYP